MTRPLFLVAWIVLIVLGLFSLFAAGADLNADLHGGIPTDHQATFAALTGVVWGHAQATALGMARYVTLLETGYALHELVFGIFFLVIVILPFRQGQRWAWWGCWAVLIADIGYSLTFGRYDPTLLRQSLIADIATPLALLLSARRFFTTPAK
jgi:hypothetical protein